MKKHERLKLELVNGQNKNTYVCHISDDCRIILNCKHKKDSLSIEYSWFGKLYLKVKMYGKTNNKDVISEFIKAFDELYSGYKIYPDYYKNGVVFQFPITYKANVIEGLRMASKISTLLDYVEDFVQNGDTLKEEIRDMSTCYGLNVSVIQDRILDEINDNFDFAVIYNNGNSLFHVHKFMDKNEVEEYYRSSGRDSFNEKAERILNKTCV